LALERNVIFDDSVMHDDDAAGAVTMGVRVFFRGTAMGCPAGVSNSISPVERFEANDLFEIAKFALRPANLEPFSVAADRNSSGIVPAIFELPQPFNDDGDNLFFANVTNNAAHTSSSSQSKAPGTHSQLDSRYLKNFRESA